MRPARHSRLARIVRATSGLSLIEIVISLAILLTVILALFGLFPRSFMAMHQASGLRSANNLAQSILEERRTRPFDELATEAATEQEVNRVVYKTQLTVRVDPEDPKLKWLRVEVTWKEREQPCRLSQQLLMWKSE